MIGQYLSNTNEKATASILQNILELNKQGRSQLEIYGGALIKRHTQFGSNVW
jgi:hypothetical protein